MSTTLRNLFLLPALCLPLTAHAQCGVTLSSPTTVISGTSQSDVAAVDINADGAMDIVSINGLANSQLFVAINLGNGVFAPPVATNLTGSAAVRMVAADFDHDGLTDLVIASTTSHSVTFVRNNTSASPAIGPAISTGGTGTGAIAAADVNHDGNLDLVVVNSTSNNVSIMLGNGSGGFTFSSLIPTPLTTPIDVALADFNGDGDIDLAVSSSSSQQVAIFTSNASGTFALAQTYSPAGAFPGPLVAADFNNDGHPDFACASTVTHNLVVFLNSGSGLFTQGVSLSTSGRPMCLKAVDLNGDGKLDLAGGMNSTNGIETFLGLGTGGFGPSTFLATPVITSLATGFFNNDETVDLAAINPSATQIYFNDYSNLPAISSQPTSTIVQAGQPATFFRHGGRPPSHASMAAQRRQPHRWRPVFRRQHESAEYQFDHVRRQFHLLRLHRDQSLRHGNFSPRNPRRPTLPR